jgi:catechol 2,3-dioxygenase-like lactoylglutathione lyase family enzyme
MIDHIGFPLSDYERAKAFYVKALAPLDYVLVMEVAQEQAGHDPAAGFGANGKPDFWIGGEGGLNKPLHVAILAKDRATVDAFYKAALATGGRDNGAPGIRAHYHPNYYGAFVLDPDGTTLRRCATRPRNRVPTGNIAAAAPLLGCRLNCPKSRPRRRDNQPSRRADPPGNPRPEVPPPW